MFGYGGHGAWLIPMSIGMVLVLGLIIWVIYAYTRNDARTDGFGSPKGNAQSVLDQRLALGEIDEVEYERLRKLISEKGSASVDGTHSRT